MPTPCPLTRPWAIEGLSVGTVLEKPATQGPDTDTFLAEAQLQAQALRPKSTAGGVRLHRV